MRIVHEHAPCDACRERNRQWAVATEQHVRLLSIKPEDHATKSRDYGRGFAEALRLVREALTSEKGASHAPD